MSKFCIVPPRQCAAQIMNPMFSPAGAMMAFDHRRVSLQSGCIREPGAGGVRVFHQDVLDAKLPPSPPRLRLRKVPVSVSKFHQINAVVSSRRR
ncbi:MULTISPECIES: hypothetical protein [Rhizobium]|uniref:Uncharacterized protein n=1 Tax=Rhizobium tropici TaxID=398 RepID=A0A6P1CEU5_RHITR|nr:MULTISPECIES: hypothetical protein [Rhizobium]MBB4242129.1 hypothetical protein [Rhizobium tropici]MBB5593846.1 hypothetical protein [Rhizobium tropici]MBB6492454.1 hypothetical protein [Rhizobium tropici]NEV14662.1 hypothetical protein [Rhizobium tropici]